MTTLELPVIWCIEMESKSVQWLPIPFLIRALLLRLLTAMLF